MQVTAKKGGSVKTDAVQTSTSAFMSKFQLRFRFSIAVNFSCPEFTPFSELPGGIDTELTRSYAPNIAMATAGYLKDCSKTIKP